MAKGSPEAIYRATSKYNATHTKQFPLRLNIKTDADIIEHLLRQENMQGYLKSLIRKDIAAK